MGLQTCLFCLIVNGSSPAVIVHEDQKTLAFMDLYPATPGHALVIPKSHIEDISMMPGDLGAHIMVVAITLAKAIMQRLAPSGLNLVQSNGPIAGQTVFHFHLHVIPRYENHPMTLQFGHGTTPADLTNLQRLAAVIRSGIPGQ